MKASENPFRSEAIAKLRYRIEPEALKRLAQSAAEAMGAACILGPMGTGKTTLLEDLIPHIQDLGLDTHAISLNTDSTRETQRQTIVKIAGLGPTDCILLDGGEILGRMSWWKICRLVARHQVKLIATLHNNRGLRVLHETSPNWPMAKELIQALSERDLEEVAAESFMQSRGNIREVFRACYWACALDSE